MLHAEGPPKSAHAAVRGDLDNERANCSEILTHEAGAA